MRGLFKGIRKTMLEKNNIKKYLLYATGEILLVVIGILLALQINNWNENQRKLKEEQAIINNLKVELTQNLKQLSNKTISTNYNIDALTLLIKKMNTNAFVNESDSLGLMLSRITSPLTYDPFDGVMKDIVNSGKINLITNETLRLSITSWESNLTEAKEIERFIEQLNFSDLRPYLLDKVSARNYYSSQFESSEFTWNPSSVLMDKTFENLLVRSAEFSVVLKNRYDNLKSEIEKMLAIIEDEIKY